MNKSRALCLGITAGLLIACGVIMGVLMYELSDTIVAGMSERGDSKYQAMKNISGPVWLVGIVYVFPGLLCFIAAFVQNKCFYITSCSIAMICIVIMGLAIAIIGFPVILVIMVLFNLQKHCADDLSGCRCTDEKNEVSITPFKDCSIMEDVVNLSLGLAVIIVVAWIFLVAAFIIACVYACRSKTTAGTVYTPAQQPMLTH